MRVCARACVRVCVHAHACAVRLMSTPIQIKARSAESLMNFGGKDIQLFEASAVVSEQG